MARIGFLSHSDMSLYFFRMPIMKKLSSLGHKVFAICPNGKFVPNLKNDFEVVTYNIDKASLNPLRVMRDTKDLAKILKELNLDMIQTSAHKSNVFGTFAAKKAGIKVIINLVEGLGSFYIDNDLKTRFVRFMIERLYKKAFKISNGCIFVNDADPKYFISKKIISPSKVKVIKSVGIDTKKFSPDRYEKYNFGSKKVVLMISRALWHKGIKEFYKAAEILKNRDDAIFLFAGEGDEFNKSCANKEFLESKYVKYVGFQKDTISLYRSAYMFVLPSYKEGFPRTILEAMSMAKAVVASNVTGCNEAVVDKITGLLCKKGSATDLANKIKFLLDNEDLCHMMGQNGRAMVLQNYDEKKIVKSYIRYYRTFINV